LRLGGERKDRNPESSRLDPDVLLLDLAMPVMNGLEAARTLKRLMPNVPIVVFSAYADSFTEEGSAFCGRISSGFKIQ
jgi:CheY-like chemotaxis protein